MNARPPKPPAVVSAYSGWVPFLCVIAAIALLATSAITWVTAPNWGLHNVIAAPRDVGVTAPTSTPAGAKVQDVSLSPFSIEIPAIKAEAPILDIGTSADKELEPPQDPTKVGWWKYGAKPGAATGTAVITGHINYAGVAGALGEIGRLNPGEGAAARRASLSCATSRIMSKSGAFTRVTSSSGSSRGAGIPALGRFGAEGGKPGGPGGAALPR